MSGKRNIALDITKIIAVLAVVMIHVGGIFVSSYERGSAEFMWGNIINVKIIQTPLNRRT